MRACARLRVLARTRATSSPSSQHTCEGMYTSIPLIPIFCGLGGWSMVFCFLLWFCSVICCLNVFPCCRSASILLAIPLLSASSLDELQKSMLRSVFAIQSSSQTRNLSCLIRTISQIIYTKSFPRKKKAQSISASFKIYLD